MELPHIECWCSFSVSRAQFVKASSGLIGKTKKCGVPVNQLEPHTFERTTRLLVLVLPLGEFEDPTGHEEQTKADTDDEYPPIDGNTEKDDCDCRAQAERPPAPWSKATINTCVFGNLAVFLVINTGLILFIEQSEILRDQKLHSDECEKGDDADHLSSAGPDRVHNCDNE